MTTHAPNIARALTATLLLATTACGDDVTGGSGMPPDSDSGFTSGNDSNNPTTPGGSSGGETGGPGTGNATNPDNPGSDDGEPPDPGDEVELCDAGNEAFVKRLIPLAHGRKPESIREVRLLASIIEQLDARDIDGRRAVTLGLLRGDAYLDRYKDYLYEELRVNLSGDRRNETCYDLQGSESNGTALAEFIRDNDVADQYPGPLFWMPDVTYSALRLDDMSPLLRADTFARLSAPFIAGNVTNAELEEMRVAHFGRLFEATIMGRTTDCLPCHRAEWATTDHADPAFDRHYPLPGYLELGAYGLDPDEPEPTQEGSFAIFRYQGFAEGQVDTLVNNGVSGDRITPFGFGYACGGIDLTPNDSMLGWDGFLLGDYQPDDTLVALDARMRTGFDALRDGGLDIQNDESVEAAEAGAYLMAMHMSNRMWRHAMGFPLQVANGFPRNQYQRDILEELTNSFVSNEFSLRHLIADIATHDYFNQSPPDTCGASTPYHLPPVFEPFSREAGDPAMKTNGVGDTVRRYGSRVLLDSIAQSMWWNKPDVFGSDADTNEIPGAFGNPNGCGANMPDVPCVDAPQDASVLRDTGSFLSDSDSGFSGTDLLVMLRLENEFGGGVDPGMHGDCTGPLGAACAGEDWITQLVDVAVAEPGSDMWDVAAAVKDRMVTDPAIRTQAEVAALENLMGVSLSDTVADVGAGAAEQAARRLAGMLTNTPQFMLAGVPSRDIDEADDPTLIVPGTTTEALCAALAPVILDNGPDGITQGYTCSASGITLD
jgi:hypothetical protein